MIASIDSKKCTGCGSCVRKCTLDVFSLNTDQPDIAPCMAGCPCGTDIRGILYLLQQDKREEALALLKRTVPFPALTSRLCGHPCEDSCIRQNGEQLDICGLERWLGALDLETPAACVPESHIAHAAVVGAGLAGLSCAAFLRMRGYPVTVFEASSGVGGALKALVAEGMPAELLDYCEKSLRAMGVQFRFDTAIGKHGDITLEDLIDRGFRSVCLAVGDKEKLSEFPEITGTSEAPLLYGATCARQVFVAGGCHGAASVEDITAQARHAAISMHAFMNGTAIALDLPRRDVAEVLPPLLPTLPPGIGNRKDDWTSVMGLEDVQTETMRCLTCGSKAYISHPDDCMTCFTCEMNCPVHAVDVHPFKEVLPRSLEK